MNQITQEQVDKIYDEAIKQTFDVFGKCLIMACKLSNGFVIVESSACVDPQNFSFDIGRRICEERIKNKIWELEGYALQKLGESNSAEKAPDIPMTEGQKKMSEELAEYFGKAIEKYANDKGMAISDVEEVFKTIGE